jgi:hypothetical protein
MSANVFSAEMIARMTANCDERIASVQQKIDSWMPHQGIMGLMLNMYEEKGDEEGISVFKNNKYDDKVKNYENSIKLIQTEKLIYLALSKLGNGALFPKLLAKYDELMGVSYDLSGNMVNTGINQEGDHLTYCKQSLDQREYIRKLCLYGEKR